MRKLFVLLSLMVICLVTPAVLAQELDPLLQLLIEKKVLTSEEAKQVQNEYDKKKESEKKETKKTVDEATKPFKSFSKALEGVKIGGTYYLAYQNGTLFDAHQEDGLKSHNKFVLKRAYFDFKKDVTPYLTTRFTPDLNQDSSGNYNLRLKYFYADFKWKGNNAFSKPHLEVGLVHTPYLDFEETMNGFRVQDPMAVDRFGIISSADSGIMFGANFGPPLPKTYQNEVTKAYPGKWGSFAIGIYNGGGYSSKEKNTNKVLMGRFTFRPLPAYLPGFQFTYLGGTGKGNNEPTNYSEEGIFYNERIYPDFDINLFMLSYEHQWFTLYGLYYEATGTMSGKNYYVPSDYVAGKVDYSDIFKGYDQKGYSFYGNVKLGAAKKWNLWVRYDYYDPDTKGILDLQDKEDIQKRTIYGIAYKLYKDNLILLDYERLSHTKKYSNILYGTTTIPDEERLQLNLQIKF